MKSLFDELIEQGEAGLRALVEARQQEHLKLDFKLKRDAGHGGWNDEDRKTLSEMISAFSNSAGGLLVWGVDARNVDGVDCAVELKPICGIEAFQSTAHTLIGQFLMPRHEGIRIATIRCDQADDRGYLLVDVERSERRPHRSEAKGRKGYFKRAGDSTFEMEHYDIEDAFKRTSVPHLEREARIEVNAGGSGPDGRRYQVRISIGLRNSSPLTAKFPYLSVLTLRRFEPHQGFVARHDPTRSAHFHGGAHTVIHPDELVWVTFTDLDTRIHSGGDIRVSGTPIDRFRLSLETRFGCENSRQQIETFHMNGTDFSDMIK